MLQDIDSETLRRIIGTTARQARARLELTQQDVAERIDLVTEVYGRIERGGMAPSVQNLRRLCLVLDISADVALGITRPDPAEAFKHPPPEPRQPGSKYLVRLLRRAQRLPPQAQRLLVQFADGLLKLCPEEKKRSRRSSSSSPAP